MTYINIVIDILTSCEYWIGLSIGMVIMYVLMKVKRK